MRRGTTITTEVNVYTYVDAEIEVSDVLNEISDVELIQEVRDRSLLGYNKVGDDNISIKDIYIALCDRYAKNHHTNWSELIDLLNQEISE